MFDLIYMMANVRAQVADLNSGNPQSLGWWVANLDDGDH